MTTFEVTYCQYEKLRFLQPYCDFCKKTISNHYARYEVIGTEKRKHVIFKHQSPLTDYTAIVCMTYVCSEECATMFILSRL
jgi:hypothetical protein